MTRFGKQEKLGLAAAAIVLVVYHVLVFAIPFAKTLAFWMSYFFGLIAILAQVPFLYLAFSRGHQVKSKIYGFPLARVGALYLVAQLIVSLICMALAVWMPVAVPTVLGILLLGAAGLGLVAAESVREEIERQDVKLVKDVSAMKVLKSRAGSLPAMCRDEEGRRTLEELAEAFRYSDPVSAESTRGAEQELSALVDALERAIEEQDAAAVQVLSRRCTQTLAERNRICKLSKQNV